MTAPDRIWIDAWGGNWSPKAGGTQEVEYVRADLVRTIPLADALAVPEVKALMEAARDRLHYWVSDDDHCTCGACEPLIAALRAMEGRDG